MHNRSQVQITALYVGIYVIMTFAIFFAFRELARTELSKNIQTFELESVIYNERMHQVMTPVHDVLGIPDYSEIDLGGVSKFVLNKRAVLIKYGDKELLLNPTGDPYFYENRRHLAPITYGLLQDVRLRGGKKILVEQVFEYEQ